jgi:hypothetical protein
MRLQPEAVYLLSLPQGLRFLASYQHVPEQPAAKVFQDSVGQQLRGT